MRLHEVEDIFGPNKLLLFFPGPNCWNVKCSNPYFLYLDIVNQSVRYVRSSDKFSYKCSQKIEVILKCLSKTDVALMQCLSRQGKVNIKGDL